LAEGFIYNPIFISGEEEQSLVRAIEELEFADVKRDAAEAVALTPGLSCPGTCWMNV